MKARATSESVTSARLSAAQFSWTSMEAARRSCPVFDAPLISSEKRCHGNVTKTAQA